MSGWRIVSKGGKLRVEPYGPAFSSIKLPVGKSQIFIDGTNSIPKILDEKGNCKAIHKGENIGQHNMSNIYPQRINDPIFKLSSNSFSF